MCKCKIAKKNKPKLIIGAISEFSTCHAKRPYIYYLTSKTTKKLLSLLFSWAEKNGFQKDEGISQSRS